MLSIIVPVYNEEESLPLLYEEVQKNIKEIETDIEYIFVDDGSKDRSVSVMKELSAKDDSVKYLTFSRNFGKEAAMFAGLRAAKGEYVVIMDADLQDPPALLEKMYHLLTEGEVLSDGTVCHYDSVATRRVSRKGEPIIRSFFARMFYRLINRMTTVDIVDGARDYRMMSRKFVDGLLELKEYNRFSKGLFGWVGFKTKWLEFENIERRVGETKWSFWKLFAYAIEGIVAFSTLPLSFSSYAGAFMSFLSFFMLIVIVVRRSVFGDPVDGWASTACIIIFLGGLQLFFLGLMGEYLSKVYLEVKRRPIYILAETNIENIEE